MSTEESYRTSLTFRYPFWTALSPTVIRQRIEQILAAPDLEAVIQALSPVEYTLLVKAAAENRPMFLDNAQPQQIRLLFDLDCWDKDTLRSQRVIAWLEELLQSGPEVFRNALEALDQELLVLTFRQHIRVHATLPSEEEDEPSPYDEVLANELYRIEFVSAETLLHERMAQVLQALRLTDLDVYHNLMQGVMWGQDGELQEWAYRWKSGRLQDEGFPDYYEAVATYSLLDLDQPVSPAQAPIPVPGIPESAEHTGVVPGYAWGPTPRGSLLDAAVAGELPLPTQERLCWEMVYLCNRELVVDQVDFAEAEAVRASLSRVHAYLNIGLEYLRQTAVQPVTFFLTTYSLQAMYQIGFTLALRLHQRALSVAAQVHCTAGVRRALPGLVHQVVEGLLDRPPQFFEGVLVPGDSGYRTFLSLQDIHQVERMLTLVEEDPAYHGPQRAA